MAIKNNITFFSFSGIGKRANNEDAYRFSIISDDDSSLFMVCDGVGGRNKGEIASALVCDSFKNFLETKPDFSDINWVNNAIKYTEQQFDLAMEQDSNTRGMASTLALVAFQEKNILIAHCGDSRVYHFRNKEILFETKDHSYINWMIDRGEMTKEEAKTHPKRNVITRYIGGTQNPTKADVQLITDWKANDFILLCTDGFLEAWNNREVVRLMVPENEVYKMAVEMEEKCSLLSDDNYTATLIKIN
ncbi:MAG: serine/threonine-protein phosphatase [Bacteroidetes bacterium]|nr:serine/threonine-protein phosphatase [Bacteroidota bacterium]